MLAPLTSSVQECGRTKVTKAKKTKKRPWYWDEAHQIAFDNVNAAITKDVVLAYPDFSNEFEIYTDASSTKQLGSVITQSNRPLAFFSRKLSVTQQKYSAAKSTKVCGPFDDADLASHILRMVPRNWQDQYELSGALVPQSVRELLEVLERIEKAYPTEKADLQSIVSTNCTHLSLQDQNSLLELLTEFEELLTEHWVIGTQSLCPSNLRRAKPYHGKAYPVPKSRKETTIKELNRLCKLGVVEFQPESEWASPSFITGKQDGTVRFLTDFREVNKRLVQKPFPLPKISTVLQELEGFTYATTLDLNMGYYTIRLDPDSSKICTLIFPWGKYSYLRLPMGIAGSVITQGNRPLAFFSRKLSTTQQKYSVTELELLAIVETLKEFKGMLWGQRLKVYTDHKNLIQDALGLTSDRVYRWRLLLEEFGPKLFTLKAYITLLPTPSLA
eukprot:CCRYP_002458-RA/>CCRYP_002458-RA protein AED:0.31 eAED:0.57 QI:0/0/0/1/0/0/4/0/443